MLDRIRSCLIEENVADPDLSKSLAGISQKCITKDSSVGSLKSYINLAMVASFHYACYNHLRDLWDQKNPS